MRSGEGKGVRSEGGGEGRRYDGGEEEEEEEEEEGPVQEEEECSVCHASMVEAEGAEDGDRIGLLRCYHRFHDQCLYLWASHCGAKHLEATCPMCRGALVRAER